MWFDEEGDPRHAVYLAVNKSKPVVVYELVKGWLTGTSPDIGELHSVGDTRSQ